MTPEFKTHTVAPDAACPHCHHTLDAATGVESESAPSEGDISICWYCGNWLVFDRVLKPLARTQDGVVFDPQLTVRPITEEEIAALPQETFLMLSRVSRSFAQFKKETKETGEA